MTTDIERQFFETFEVPKTCQRGRVSCKQYNRECDKCCYLGYPQITDRILLELRALSNRKTYEEYKAEELKKVISIMSNNPYKKSQVQSLFKEG